MGGRERRSIGDLNANLAKSSFTFLESLAQLSVLPLQAIGVASNHGAAVVSVGCFAGMLSLLTRRTSARVAIALDFADLQSSRIESV